MASNAQTIALAAQARRSYVEGLLAGLGGVVQGVEQGARRVLSLTADPATMMRRRDAVEDLKVSAGAWLQGADSMLRSAMLNGMVSASRPNDLPLPGGRQNFSLVDNETIEGEILSSRLALAVMDRASWEFTDLRARMTLLEGRDELEPNDVLRPHVLARIAITTWRSAGLSHDAWRTLQAVLHQEFALFNEEAYHEANRRLIEQRVLPEIDLRPLIRRSRPTGFTTTLGNTVPVPQGLRGPAASGADAGARVDVGQETRLMTRAGSLGQGGTANAEAVLSRLNRLIGRQLPEFARTGHMRAASSSLQAAISNAQQGIALRFSPSAKGGLPSVAGAVSTPSILEELDQRKQVLKAAAGSPAERATIEVVALLFQSILTEERIPATIRVWFARLQMPVLRVAVGEPDFFATIDHPARRLIDRMGSCVMGFDANNIREAGGPVEREIKRVVQVVEAYPDTGRRVFQTVLIEFEKFLEHYFENENEASRKGVSLAQQVEQRETLAIQYTIELRRMLNDVPVQEGVRDFLFQVWADVLAMTAVKSGLHSDETKVMKRTAADLIWSVGAKVSRDERADVIRRLPPLLKVLRDGMQSAGVSVAQQDEHIQRLNNSLAAAFTARTAAIPKERLEQLMSRLETLEELLPDADELEIDESLVLDLSGHESSELEVVSMGGSMPTPAMTAWARELQVGSWYMLDHSGRNESVQLAWRGLRHQLTLFVSPIGRGILFQQQRLAAFLQAGLLVPVQEESLTVRATRSALAKLDVDPSRLLN